MSCFSDVCFMGSPAGTTSRPAEAIPGAIGLSSSTVSRGFVKASAAKLREMQERDLSGEDVVAIFLGGEGVCRRHDGGGRV